MVSVISSYTVIPSEPTYNGPLWLSGSDQVVPWTHTTSIYIYKANYNNGIIERMRDSLSKILVHYYPLAGRLSWIGGGRAELQCNAKGVKLFEAESTKTFAEYGDFSPKEPIKELIPTVDYTQPIEELPLLLVQLTRFHGSDEGLAIGVAFCHCVADGLSAIRFINSWAKLARGDSLDPDEMFPVLDRTALKPSHPPVAPRFHHREFRPTPTVLGNSDRVIELKKETNIALLKLTSEQVEKLKMKANDKSRSELGSKPHSRYEALAAHIWRSASKARHVGNHEHQPTLVRVNADIRNRLNPPLPRNYFGNALLPTLTPTCHMGEIISNPLSYAAQKIREGLDMLTNEYLRSQLDFIRDQEQMDRIRMSNHVQGDCRDVPFYGNPNLNIVSWLSMPVYGADFGWGKPVYFGPGAKGADGKAHIILSPDGDGSVIVAIRLQIAHMQLFKKFFYEDI